MLGGDLVSEEFRRAGTRVRDQGLLGAEFQSEGFPEELRQFRLDFLGRASRDWRLIM